MAAKYRHAAKPIVRKTVSRTNERALQHTPPILTTRLGKGSGQRGRRPQNPIPAELEAIEKLCLADPYVTDRDMAKAIGWLPETFFNHKHEFIPYIEKGRLEGRKQFFKDVISAAKKCMIGYSYDELHEEQTAVPDENAPGGLRIVSVKKKKIKKQVPPQYVPQMFWIVNNSKRLNYEEYAHADTTIKDRPLDGVEFSVVPPLRGLTGSDAQGPNTADSTPPADGASADGGSF